MPAGLLGGVLGGEDEKPESERRRRSRAPRRSRRLAELKQTREAAAKAVH